MLVAISVSAFEISQRGIADRLMFPMTDIAIVIK